VETDDNSLIGRNRWLRFRGSAWRILRKTEIPLPSTHERRNQYIRLYIYTFTYLLIYFFAKESDLFDHSDLKLLSEVFFEINIKFNLISDGYFQP
jgi:hypothetical protein